MFSHPFAEKKLIWTTLSIVFCDGSLKRHILTDTLVAAVVHTANIQGGGGPRMCWPPFEPGSRGCATSLPMAPTPVKNSRPRSRGKAVSHRGIGGLTHSR